MKRFFRFSSFFSLFFIFFTFVLFAQQLEIPPEERRRKMEYVIPGSESNTDNQSGSKRDSKKREKREEKKEDERSNTWEERDGSRDEGKTEKKDRTITINSARTTEYKKVKTKRKKEKTSVETSLQDLSKKEINEEDKDSSADSEESDGSSKNNAEVKNTTEEEYEEIEEELVIFTGNVSISVSDGSSTSTIIADRVIYNKSRSTMEATGSVQFERKVGSQVAEKFTGEYLLFDIEKLQGVFYNGIVQQASNKKGRDPFSIHTYIAGKDESGVIGFKNSFLTTSKSEDSLWSIRASRLWILPGNEMAFANGVLSIGVVPLFYLPFFYYPADEMLFHPVFGFRNKEGYFLQTTTYIIGRKPLAKQDKASSFSNFLQGDTLKKQKLEALFFKKLDEPDSIQDPSYLKVMFDMYSRLGYLVGMEGKFTPRKGYVKEVNFAAFLGFSYTIYPVRGSPNLFSSFAPSANKKSELNKSNLFGKIVPLRYNFDFNMSLTKDPFNVSLSFPFISDPFFKRDFLSRGEDMNWFNYLLNKDKLAKEASSKSEETSYMWKVLGSIRPSFNVLRPYISSISFDDISTALNFYSKTNSKLSGQDALYSPERKFYYPQSAKPFFKMSLAGTIFSTSMLEKKTKTYPPVDMDALLKEIENPFLDNADESNKKKEKSDKIEKNTEEAKGTNEDIKTETKEDKKEKKKKLSEMNEEELQQKIDEVTSEVYLSLTDEILPLYKFSPPQSPYANIFTNIVKYDLTYRLSGQAVYEAIFDHDKWKEPKDINWKDFYSKYYQFKSDATINSSLSIYKGFLTLNNSFAFSSNYQWHPYIKDATKEDSFKLNNYKANLYNLKNTNVLKLSPFIDFDMFKGINFSWELSSILLQRKFIGTVTDPKWEIEKVKWKKETITTHAANAAFAFSFKGHTQSLSLSMNLKPLLLAYSFSSSFSFPYVKMGLSTKYFEKENASKKWFWDPLKFTTNVSLPYNISLSQEYVYNIEDKAHDKYSLSFSWKWVSASYLMSRTQAYKLDSVAGWQPDGKEKKFIPSSFNISVSTPSSVLDFYFWKNRIQFNATINAALSFNLVRLTDSYFTFSPRMTFKIHEFVDVSFGVTSRNDAIIKYFASSFNLPIQFPGETNIFKDIGYSFFFWDTEKRRMSDFKLKSIDFQLAHNLKDWTMTISYSIKPTLKTEAGKKVYKFDPVISFFVQWNPIGDIKIKAKEEEKKFSLERGEIR